MKQLSVVCPQHSCPHLFTTPFTPRTWALGFTYTSLSPSRLWRGSSGMEQWEKTLAIKTHDILKEMSNALETAQSGPVMLHKLTLKMQHTQALSTH